MKPTAMNISPPTLLDLSLGTDYTTYIQKAIQQHDKFNTDKLKNCGQIHLKIYLGVFFYMNIYLINNFYCICIFIIIIFCVIFLLINFCLFIFNF